MNRAERLLASVVIPTHDRCASLLRALDKLGRQSLLPSAMEVVVVADGCTDQSAQLARAFPAPYRLVVIEQPNSGPAVARNAGAAAARAPLLVFMDDDVEPDDGFVAAHIRAHRDGRDLAVIGYYPPVRYGRGIFGEAVASWWEQTFAAMAKPNHVFGFTDLLTGNLSLSAELFRRVGGFDPALRVHEDYEFGLRLLAAGASLRFSRDAWGRHHERSDVERASRRKIDEGRADVIIGRCHPNVIPQLPLARYRGRKHGMLRLLAFLAPQLGDVLARLCRVLMDAAELHDHHRAWQRLFELLLGYWYWRGVADEIGRLSRLKWFVRREQT